MLLRFDWGKHSDTATSDDDDDVVDEWKMYDGDLYDYTQHYGEDELEWPRTSRSYIDSS
jgi:hypothetical protein